MHNDVAALPWQALFHELSANPASYQREPRSNVRGVALAGSFYQPLLPPASVHLATSAMSLHWLSNVPCVPQGLRVYSALLPADRERFLAQQLADWSGPGTPAPRRRLTPVSLWQARFLRPPGAGNEARGAAGGDGALLPPADGTRPVAVALGAPLRDLRAARQRAPPHSAGPPPVRRPWPAL